MTATAGDTAFVAHAAAFEQVTGEAPGLALLAEVDAHEGPVYFADENALYFTSLPRPGSERSAGPTRASGSRRAHDGSSRP